MEKGKGSVNMHRKLMAYFEISFFGVLMSEFVTCVCVVGNWESVGLLISENERFEVDVKNSVELVSATNLVNLLA